MGVGFWDQVKLWIIYNSMANTVCSRCLHLPEPQRKPVFPRFFPLASWTIAAAVVPSLSVPIQFEELYNSPALAIPGRGLHRAGETWF